MFRWCLLLACVAVCSHAVVATRPLDHLKYALYDFSSDSAASPVSSSSSSSSQTPNYSGSVTHIPLKGRYRVDVEHPRHIERNGVSLMAIDAPIIGCPMMDFSAPVTIGGQGPFELIVDTGSTSLGIASTTCGANCPVSSEYNPNGATQLGATFSSTFGDGSGWQGPAVSDAVSVGGSKSTTIQLAAISTQNRFFRSSSCAVPGQGPGPNQGIIGFAFAGLGVQGVNAAGTAAVAGVRADAWFIKNAAATGAAPVFALRMCSATGDLFLNGYDTNSFNDQIHWTNVAVDNIIQQNGNVFALKPGVGYWTVAVQSIGVVGGAADNNVQDFQGDGQTFGVNSIVDSGTTVALLPDAAFTTLVAAIPANAFQQWFGTSPQNFFAQYQCSTSTASAATMNAALPQSVVTIGNTNSGTPVAITLNGVNFLLQQVSTTGQTLFCSGIQPNGQAQQPANNVVILGWSFMNQLIVVHDTQNAKIGFAPRNAGCADGSQGAVAVTGGDVNVVDPTGGNGQSTAGGKPPAATTTKPAAGGGGANPATPFPIPANPCAQFGCPSKNANCAKSANGNTGTTGPAGVAAAQCVIAYMKVVLNINMKNGMVTGAANAAAVQVFNSIINFVKMNNNNNAAVNLDPKGLALNGNTLSITLDVTAVAASAAPAAKDVQTQLTMDAFAGSGLDVQSFAVCDADQADATGTCLVNNAVVTDGNGGSGGMSMVVIIGAAAGGVALLILIVVGVVMYRRRSANKTFSNNSANMNAAQPPQQQQPWSPNSYNNHGYTNGYMNGGNGQQQNWTSA